MMESEKCVAMINVVSHIFLFAMDIKRRPGGWRGCEMTLPPVKNSLRCNLSQICLLRNAGKGGGASAFPAIF